MQKRTSELETGDIAYRPRDNSLVVVGETEVAFSAVLCNGQLQTYRIPREVYASEDLVVEVLGPTVNISDIPAYKIPLGDSCEDYGFLESDIAGKCLHGDIVDHESEPVSQDIQKAVCKILGNRGFAGYEKYRDEPAQREKVE